MYILTDKYNCICKPGFEGFSCEVVKDGCKVARGGNPRCRNGGTCTSTADGGYSCACTSGFDGSESTPFQFQFTK
jgi:hypothetical protein